MADEYKENGSTSIISMLGSVIAALGYEVTDNVQAAVAMLKMQKEILENASLRDFLTGNVALKTIQNISTGAWYIPGKLIHFVQEYLASELGGGYPGYKLVNYVSPNKYNFKGKTSTLNIGRFIESKANIDISTFEAQWPDEDFSKDSGVWLLYENGGQSNGYNEFVVLAKLISITLSSNEINYIFSEKYLVKCTGVSPQFTYTYQHNSNGTTSIYGSDMVDYYGKLSLESAYTLGMIFRVIIPNGTFVSGGGITRGGGVSRHSLPQEESFPPCGGDTTVPQITQWSNRVINWNGECYMPLTYYKVNPSNENPGTVPGSPSTPIEPDDPTVDPETIIKYIYPNNEPQDVPQNGDNTVQTTGQLKDNYTNANNGPSDIPNTDIKGGLYTLWHPSADNLQKLGAFLYGGTTQGTIASIIGDPINAIIQLTEWAVTPVDGPVKSPVICNIGATELKMPTIPNQFMQFDCGIIEIPREYHDFRDYEPYTRLSLFLPFVGDVNISTNDCITPHKIHVIYNIDFLSGVACAEVLIDEDVRYAYQAAMCAAVPVTSSDASRLIASIIGAAVGTVGGGVMGGIVGGTAGSRMAARALIGGASEVAMSPINGIQTQRTGSISANTGLLGEMKPYVLVTRPISVVADQYKSLLGQPYQLDGTLGSQKGFVKVREVHLDGITATETEKTEIERMLKEGVIL